MTASKTLMKCVLPGIVMVALAACEPAPKVAPEPAAAAQPKPKPAPKVVTPKPKPKPAAPRQLASFTITEHFDVAHPDQIIDFDLAVKVDPAKAMLLDLKGRPVAFQLLEGGRKLAVRTDLPARATRTWKLMTAAKPAPVADPQAVRVDAKEGYYEITNGLVGIRVAKAVAAPGKTPPAPIQGVRYRDGTWSGAGPNALTVQANATEKMTVRFIERGPLKTVAQVRYAFDRPEYRHGKQFVKEAGKGFYTCTITVQAGQPSVLFEEDADMNLSWSLDLYAGLEPDQARYRGHHSRKAEHGRNAKGQVYRRAYENRRMDAFFDLPYDRAYRSWYRTDFGKRPTIRRVAVWDPWVYDSGWYWQAYNKAAGAKANVLGLFAGRASRALGAAASGTGLWTAPGAGGKRSAGLTVQTLLRGPDARTFPRVRYQWGLLVGTKGADLTAPDTIQTVNRQMNLHGGFNLNKIHRYRLDFPDPPQGYGAMFMPRKAVDRMKARLRADKAGRHGKGYHGYLYAAEPYARPLVDFWRDTTPAATGKVVDKAAAMARDALDAFIHREGIYEMAYHYWHGASRMTNMATWIDQALAAEATSPADRARAKAVAALFAYLMWDDDFVPLHTGHSLNLGTPNMPVMQVNSRNLFALLLARHPVMARRVDGVRQRTLADLDRTVNAHGAHIGSVHYVGAAMYPVLNSFLQLKMVGHYDAFAKADRLAKFAEFYMNFLTPPEPRFGGRRKIVCIGDGSTEGSMMYGWLATGFASARPELSRRLMGAWKAMDRTHGAFQGSSLLKIDEELPAADPALGDANFPGWCSVLRNGWGTPNESVLWLVNGNDYYDHCHNDTGVAVIYALGSPLSVDWGPIYYPRVSGAFHHSLALVESTLGHGWDKDSPPMTAGDAWGHYRGARAKQEAFLSMTQAGYARARITRGKGYAWLREVLSIHADPSRQDDPHVEPDGRRRGRDAGREGHARAAHLRLRKQPGRQEAAPVGGEGLRATGWDQPPGVCRAAVAGRARRRDRMEPLHHRRRAAAGADRQLGPRLAPQHRAGAVPSQPEAPLRGATAHPAHPRGRAVYHADVASPQGRRSPGRQGHARRRPDRHHGRRAGHRDRPGRRAGDRSDAQGADRAGQRGGQGRRHGDLGRPGGSRPRGGSRDDHRARPGGGQADRRGRRLEGPRRPATRGREFRVELQGPRPANGRAEKMMRTCRGR